MAQIGYKGIVSATLRDRTYRSRNSGRLELFKLITSLLCSSAINLSVKHPLLPGYIGLQKRAQDGTVTSLLLKRSIISAAVSTVDTVNTTSSARFSSLIPYEALNPGQITGATGIDDTDSVEYVLYMKDVANPGSSTEDCILATAPMHNGKALLNTAITTKNNILIEWEMIFSNIVEDPEAAVVIGGDNG